MINFKEFKEIDLRIAEVTKIEGDKIQITDGNKDYSVNINLNVKEKDKIVVIVNKDKLVIPVVSKSMPLIPEKDIEPGAKVS